MILASTCSSPNGKQCSNLRTSKNRNSSDDSRVHETVFIIGMMLISANIVIYYIHAQTKEKI